MSGFSEEATKKRKTKNTIIADFWEKSIEYQFNKGHRDFDYRVIDSLVVEPFNLPTDWKPKIGDLSLLKLELRRNGDSPPEILKSIDLIYGEVSRVLKIQIED